MELFQYLLGWLYITLIKVIFLLPDNEMVDFKRDSQLQQCSQMLLKTGGNVVWDYFQLRINSQQ